MIDVSVPCQCGADISFGHTACPSCKAPVTRALRDDLEARLEHTHTEYAEAKQKMSRSATALFVLGAIYVVLALMLYHFFWGAPVGTSLDADAMVAGLPLLSNGFLGLLFIACAASARRWPNAAFTVALAIWFVTQILVYVAQPAPFFTAFLSANGIGGHFAKVVVLVLLVRALLAARRVDAIRAEMARGPSAA